MVEEIRADPFVPNDVNLGGEEPKSMVITGTLSSTQHYVCLTDGTFLGPNMVMCAVKGTIRVPDPGFRSQGWKVFVCPNDRPYCYYGTNRKVRPHTNHTY